MNKIIQNMYLFSKLGVSLILFICLIGVLYILFMNYQKESQISKNTLKNNNQLQENIKKNSELIQEAINKINNYEESLEDVKNYVKDISKISKNLVINPEFLREKFADKDFVNSNIIVFGGDEHNCNKLSSFYKNHTKCVCNEHIITDGITASLIKYTINSFLALKVIFFNEMKFIFDNLNSQSKWLDFINALSKDKRIGDSHMNVPGPDGRYGFGGPCFPKDVSALIEYSKEIGFELSLLKKANTINNNIRAQYNDLTEREKEQNIKYNSEKE